MAATRILLADDELDARRHTRGLLTAVGFEVLEAADGAELALRARGTLPQLIIADLLMPGLDGFEAVAELQRHPATAGIPWLYLSTLPESETHTQGVARFLMKPFEREDLITAVREVAPIPAAGPAPTVLVVDDERDIVEIVRDFLEDAGYRHRGGCHDGEAALAAIAQQPPDALILDVKMPRVDGYGVIRGVKRHPAHRDIPIIILTATKVLRITHGAPPQPNPFRTVPKPCEAGPLVAAVQEVLRGA